MDSKSLMAWRTFIHLVFKKEGELIVSVSGAFGVFSEVFQMEKVRFCELKEWVKYRSDDLEKALPSYSTDERCFLMTGIPITKHKEIRLTQEKK